MKNNICIIATGKGMGNFYSNIAYFKQIFNEEKTKLSIITRELTSAKDVLSNQYFCKEVFYVKEYKRGIKGIFENL